MGGGWDEGTQKIHTQRKMFENINKMVQKVNILSGFL